MDETRILLFVLIALVLYLIFTRPVRRDRDRWPRPYRGDDREWRHWDRQRD